MAGKGPWEGQPRGGGGMPGPGESGQRYPCGGAFSRPVGYLSYQIP